MSDHDEIIGAIAGAHPTHMLVYRDTDDVVRACSSGDLDPGEWRKFLREFDDGLDAIPLDRRDMPDIGQLTPTAMTDMLGAARDAKKRAEAFEKYIGAALKSIVATQDEETEVFSIDPTYEEIHGDYFIGVPYTGESNRLDEDAVKEELGEEWVANHRKIKSWVAVRTKKA